MKRNQQVLFSAEISDIKTIYNVLKCLPYQEFAIFRPMEEGLKLTIDDSKSSEMSVYIPVDCFISYVLNTNEPITFKVSLKVFTECLHIFSDEGSPSMKLSYKQYGCPLYLVIKHSEEPITIDCELSTMNADDFTEFNFPDECNKNTIIFNGEQFVKILDTLDMLSDEFTLTISSQHPYFQITASSNMGSASVDVMKNASLVATFDCKSEFKATYNFSNLKQILKVMHFSSKVSISTGPSGLLNINLIINYDDRRLYVEYFMSSQFDEGLDD